MRSMFLRASKKEACPAQPAARARERHRHTETEIVKNECILYVKKDDKMRNTRKIFMLQKRLGEARELACLREMGREGLHPIPVRR